MAALVEVVIFDRDIYKTGHMANRWMHVMVAHFVEHAKVAAPVRTGLLRAGISGSAFRIGDRQLEGVISSGAPYSTYVLRGTGYPVKGHEGRIYSTKGFITRDKDDAYVTLWGRIDRSTGKFTRYGKGDTFGTFARKQHRVRKKGYWLAFGPDSGGRRVITFSVRGQEPNNFLVKAWRATGRTHSSIRGLPAPGVLGD